MFGNSEFPCPEARTALDRQIIGISYYLGKIFHYKKHVAMVPAKARQCGRGSPYGDVTSSGQVHGQGELIEASERQTKVK